MDNKATQISYTKVLNVLYIIISLATMTIFFFVSTPKNEEYIGINSVALWGAIFAAFIVAVLIVSTVLRLKK